MFRRLTTLFSASLVSLAACPDDGATSADTTTPDTTADTVGDSSNDATAPDTQEPADTTADAAPDTLDDTTPDTTEQEDTADATPDVPDSEPGDVVYTVTLLPVIETKVFSAPLRITDDGRIAGYVAVEAWGPDSRPLVVAPDGTPTVLPVAEVQQGIAYGLRDADLVVGVNYWKPTAWIAGVETPMAIPEGFGSGVAQAVNASGLVVGSFADFDDALPPNPVGPRPCTWASATGAVTPLATLKDADPLGVAWDVNDAGLIAGAVATVDGFRATLWPSKSADPVVIPIADAMLSEAHAINVGGSMTGRVTYVDNTSAGWIAGGGRPAAVVLPPLVDGEPYSEAYDLDDEGSVVGASRFETGILHATKWVHDHDAIDLNDVVLSLPEHVTHLSSAVAIAPTSGIIAAEAVLDEGFGDSVRRIAILKPKP